MSNSASVVRTPPQPPGPPKEWWALPSSSPLGFCAQDLALRPGFSPRGLTGAAQSQNHWQPTGLPPRVVSQLSAATEVACAVLPLGLSPPACVLVSPRSFCPELQFCWSPPVILGTSDKRPRCLRGTQNYCCPPPGIVPALSLCRRHLSVAHIPQPVQVAPPVSD